MKKVVALILALVMCLSLCACGGDSDEETIYSVGDTVSSDIAELVLTSYEINKQYSFVNAGDSGYFIIVNYTLKNIGKTDLGYITANGRRSIAFNVIPTIDYNDGYTFYSNDLDLNGKSYGASVFYKPLNTYISDLKPLSDAEAAEVAIFVPCEVVENETAPLSIKMSIPSSNGDNKTETFTYKIR